jgi:two-component system sensor histidine kinase KdpD
MAARLNAEWMAVYVETSASARLPEKDRNRVVRTLALAHRLGAQTDRITGRLASEELVNYALRRNVTKIVIGKPARPRWREILFGSVVDSLIRTSGNIDVYVISGDKSEHESPNKQLTVASINLMHYIYAIAVVGAATLLAHLTFKHLATVNLAMIYQLSVVLIALKFGRGPSTLAAVLAVLAFDFFFIPPYLSFTISDTQYVITFVVMFVIAISLSTLTSTIKAQAELARKREKQTSALYMMTREQATAMGTDNVVRISVKHISDIFESKIAVLLATDSEDKKLQVVLHGQPTFDVDSKEMGVAQWVHLNNQPAGATTTTLAGAQALYLPLCGSSGIIGVLGLIPSLPERFGNPDEMHLLETFVNQMALAVQRAQLSDRRRAPREQQINT